MSAPSIKAPAHFGSHDPLTVVAALFGLLALLSLTGFLVNFGATLSDFSAFYNAGTLAAADQAPRAYDLESFRAAYRETFPGSPDGYGWFYPPTFLLVHEPLASLPFHLARTVWLVGTFALFVLAVRPWLEKPVHWMLIFGAPAIAFHWHSGQTGFLVAALVALALTGLVRSDRTGSILAGFAIGLLTLKPHLWLLLPAFLIIERRWLVIFSASMTTLMLVGLSVYAYGLETWQAMIVSAVSGYSQNHADQLHLFAKMGNLDGLLRFLGLEAVRIYVLGAALLGATITMIALKRIETPFVLRVSFAVIASFMIAPHNMIYDHTLFVPLAAMFLAQPKLLETPILKAALFVLLFWPAFYALVPGLDSFPFSVLMAGIFAAALVSTVLRTRHA